MTEVESPALSFLLHGVARLLRKRFKHVNRDSGLTRSQWQTVEYLDQNEGINQIGIGRTPRRGADHPFARLGQAGGRRIDRTPSRSIRPTRPDSSTRAGRSPEACAGSKARRAGPFRGIDRNIRVRLVAPAGDPEGVEIQPHRSVRLFDGKAEASRSWLCRRSKSKKARRRGRLQKRRKRK